MNICVIIPVHGRLSLLAWTMDRLMAIGCKVVCVGSDMEAEDLVKSMGADWVFHPNRPLGMKYNAGWSYAMHKYDPDFYVMGNASDWYGQGYLHYACTNIGSHDGFAPSIKYYLHYGPLGRLLVDNTGSAPRSSGLVLTRDVVRHFEGSPFNDTMDSDLEWSIMTNLKDEGFRIKVYDQTAFPVMGISYHKWPSAYRFDAYWNKGVQMGDGWEFLMVNFPQALDMTLW